jgi:hypothetical protein
LSVLSIAVPFPHWILKKQSRPNSNLQAASFNFYMTDSLSTGFTLVSIKQNGYAGVQ